MLRLEIKIVVRWSCVITIFAIGQLHSYDLQRFEMFVDSPNDEVEKDVKENT
jgi:hypothetical protein